MLGKGYLHDVYIKSAAAATLWAQTSLADPINWLYAISLISIILGLYIMSQPINRIREMSDVGFGHVKDESQRRGSNFRHLVNVVRARKKIGQVPPVYPNGWYALLESDDVARGEIKPFSAIGQNFAIFRDEKGEAFVLDAYCPHLGANLSVGGKVKGSCVECPFHGWRFDGRSGECVYIPYAEKVPSFARVKTWTSLEQTGWIYVWFHAEGDEPKWTPPNIEEIQDGRWKYRGRTEHFINSHIQDYSENGCDIAHFPQLHSPSLLAGVDVRYTYSRFWEFAHHSWVTSWKEGEAPNTHLSFLNLKHCMKLFGKITVLDTDVLCTQIGPSITYLEMDFTLGRSVMIQTVTPIGPLELRFIHRFYAAKSIPSPYCRIVLWGEAIMVERDIMIWNSKTYASKPILVKEDKYLAPHRRWYSQFYSENSPRLTFNKDSNDW